MSKRGSGGVRGGSLEQIRMPCSSAHHRHRHRCSIIFSPKFNAQIRSGRIRVVQQERWKNFQINRADIKDGQTSCNVKEQGREMRSTHRSSRLDALHSLEAQRTVNQGGKFKCKKKKEKRWHGQYTSEEDGCKTAATSRRILELAKQNSC